MTPQLSFPNSVSSPIPNPCLTQNLLWFVAPTFLCKDSSHSNSGFFTFLAETNTYLPLGQVPPSSASPIISNSWLFKVKYANGHILQPPDPAVLFQQENPAERTKAVLSNMFLFVLLQQALSLQQEIQKRYLELCQGNRLRGRKFHPSVSMQMMHYSDRKTLFHSERKLLPPPPPFPFLFAWHKQALSLMA